MVIETLELRLRPLSVDDLEPVQALWLDPDVRRFLFDDREITHDEARMFLRRSEADFRNHGYGLWLCFEKNDEARIAGFTGFLRSDEGDASLIFGIRPALWGRGYARQAASAVVRYALDELELPRIVADVDEPNRASVRLLEHLGLTRVRREKVNGRPLLYFEMSRR